MAADVSQIENSCFSVIGKAGQMAADLDMEAPGGEGWGDDAELQLDEGKFCVTKEYFKPDLFLVSGFGRIIITAL